MISRSEESPATDRSARSAASDAMTDNKESHHRCNGIRSRLGGLSFRVLGQAMVPRAWLLALGHLLVFAVAYWLAWLLRFDFDIPPYILSSFWSSLPWAVG